MQTDAGSSIGDRGSFLLAQLGAHASRRWAQRIAPLGIEPSHFVLLAEVVAGEGRTQQQLADSIGVHRNVMVGLIDDLEASGLVVRKPKPEDRRSNAIYSSGNARELIDRAQAESIDLEQELFGELSPATYRQLITALSGVVRTAGLRRGVHPHLAERPRRSG